MGSLKINQDAQEFAWGYNVSAKKRMQN